jgi:hypothetical protein
MTTEEHQTRSQPLLNQRRQEKKAFPNFPRGGVNGWKIVVLAVLVGGALVAFFFWRAHNQAAADAKLCRKIDRASVAWITFIEDQPVPKRTDQIKQRNDLLRALRHALCSPSNLPTTKR